MKSLKNNMNVKEQTKLWTDFKKANVLKQRERILNHWVHFTALYSELVDFVQFPFTDLTGYLSQVERWASLCPWTEWTGWAVWRTTKLATVLCSNCKEKQKNTLLHNICTLLLQPFPIKKDRSVKGTSPVIISL